MIKQIEILQADVKAVPSKPWLRLYFQCQSWGQKLFLRMWPKPKVDCELWVRPTLRGLVQNFGLETMTEAKSLALMMITRPKVWRRGQEQGLNVKLITLRLRPTLRDRSGDWGQNFGQSVFKASMLTHINQCQRCSVHMQMHNVHNMANHYHDHLKSCEVFTNSNDFGSHMRQALGYKCFRCIFWK